MSRTKLIKYNLFKSHKKCINYDFGEETAPKIELISTLSQDYDSVFVELCAGYCEYSLEYAKDNPKTLCIAVDIKEDRLMYACNLAKESGIDNLIFIRTDIAYLDKILINTTDQLYITHPDPQINKKRKRLNQNRYLQVYYNILKQAGELTLITDNQEFYEDFILNSNDLFEPSIEPNQINILPTRYNLKFINENNLTKTYVATKKPLNIN
jgi:tRNA G46 methylase TrmB